MREYGIVSPRFWIGETGKRLRGKPEVQVVAMYLTTGPHANMTGVYHLPLLYVSHETGCTIKGASKALRCLIQEAFCEYDERTETVFVVRMASWQIGDSLSPGDKRVPWLRKEVEKMPSALMRQRFLTVYGRAYHLVPDDWQPSPLEGASKPHRSQEQEQEQEQEIDQEQEIQNSVGPEPDRAVAPAVQRVFDHWRAVHAHPQAKLDAKRRRIVMHALANYSPDQLCDAISGYRNSPHHMGQNDRQTVYDSIELFLRDAAHIDAGLRFHAQPPRTDQSTLTRKNVAAVADWVPPEVRRAAS